MSTTENDQSDNIHLEQMDISVDVDNENDQSDNIHLQQMDTSVDVDNENDRSANPLIQSYTPVQSVQTSYCSLERRILSIVLVLVLVLGASIALIGLSYKPLASSSTASTAGAQTGNGTELVKNQKCVYHTARDFLNKLPNDLQEQCKPQKISNGTKLGWYRCPDAGNFTNMFIKMHCLCDSKVQCINTGKDHYRKTNCTTCRDNVHCPCQNEGTCKPCPSGHKTGEDVKCSCLHGTTGRYCNKFSSRLCRLVKDIDHTIGLKKCSNSNENNCIIEMYSTSRMICEWTESFGKESHDSYENCLNIKPNFIRDDRGENEQNATNLQKPLLGTSIGIVVLCLIGIICLIFYMCKDRRRSNRGTE